MKYALAAPPVSAVLVLIALAVVLPLGIAFLASLLMEKRSLAPIIAVAATTLPLSLIAMVALFGNTVTVDASTVTVSTGFSSHRFHIASINPASVAVAPPDTSDVGLRVAGVGLPGSLIGWFRSRAGSKMFLAMMGSGSTVRFVMSDGTIVILSAKRPDLVFSDLRRLMPVAQ